MYTTDSFRTSVSHAEILCEVLAVRNFAAWEDIPADGLTSFLNEGPVTLIVNLTDVGNPPPQEFMKPAF